MLYPSDKLYPSTKLYPSGTATLTVLLYQNGVLRDTLRLVFQ